jgi:transposase
MSYLRGPDRTQTQLLPPCLEDYVAPECPGRFIDAYVEGLDFQALGFVRAQPAATGRPAYHPADLLKLYLYGYLNRLRSSRRLEAEAGRNLELMWLLRGLRPDFKTIADFRKDNRAAFPPLFKQFNLLCRQLGLFGAELVAIDGCKFGAVNNSRRHYTSEQLAELIQKVESRIEEYLGQLDQQDQAAAGARPPSAPELREKIAALQQRQGGYQALLADLQAKDQKQISLTDPDARVMKGVHGHSLGYNVQAAVDAKHDLIVAQAVTNQANDLQQLAPLALAAKEQLAVPKLQAVADKGYYSTAQLATCEQAAVETFVPKPAPPGARDHRGKKLFGPEAFTYDPAADTYRCPGALTLHRLNEYTSRGKKLIHYNNPAACRTCPLRHQCTTGRYRTIARQSQQAVADRAADRVRQNPQVVAERKTIIEHVFGTLRVWGHDRFLMRGLEKVQAEFSLSALAYNLRRVLNLVSLPTLLASV